VIADNGQVPTTPKDTDLQRLRLGVFLTGGILVPGPNKVYILIATALQRLYDQQDRYMKDKTCWTTRRARRATRRESEC
jgi:hypothetical protein